MPRKQQDPIMPDQILCDPRLIRSVNQLSFMIQNCEDLAKYLNVMIERTYHLAPIRCKNIPLDRSFHKSKQRPDNPERALEMAIWHQCVGRVRFLPGNCRSIVSYQVPIRETNRDQAGKAIDLLGISNEGGPVVLELKIGKSTETPLRMLVEALSYAVAVRKAWNEKGGALRKQWPATLKKINPEFQEYDDVLTEVPVIGIAPVQYWKTCFGENGPRGRVEKDAWKAFGVLVRACRKRGFPPYFVQFDEGEKDEDGMPKVGGFQLVKCLDKYTQ